MKMTQKDPSLRLKSADALLHQLQKIKTASSWTKIQKKNPTTKRATIKKTVAVPPTKLPDTKQIKRGKPQRTIVTIIVVLLLTAGLLKIRFMWQSQNPAETLNSKHTSLLHLVQGLPAPLFPIQSFEEILILEEKLYEAAKSSGNQTSHFKLLRNAVSTARKESAFRLYLEYLYRFRQAGQKDTMDRQPQKTLIHQSATTYLKHLANTTSPGDKHIETGIVLNGKLFSETMGDVIALYTITTELMSLYHELSESVKQSRSGKALLHSIALARVYAQSQHGGLHPVSDQKFAAVKKLYTVPAPYETAPLRKIRTLFSLPPAKGNLQSIRDHFFHEAKVFNARTNTELESIRDKRNQNLSSLTITDFAQKQQERENLLYREYVTLLEEYDFYLSNCWYQLRLDDTPGKWSENVVHSSRGLIASFDFVTKIFITRSEPPQSGPGSREHTAWIVPMWFDGMENLQFNKPMKTQHLILTQAYTLICWKDHFTKRPLRVPLMKLIKKIENFSMETAFCLRLLMETPSEDVSKTESADTYQTFMKQSKTLTKKTYRTWSTGCSIIANHYLTSLKEKLATKERYAESLKIMKILSRFPEKEYYYPKPNLPGFYAGPASLRKVAFFHCIDAANELKIDFAKDQPELEETLKTAEKLGDWARSIERVHIKSDATTARRLQKGEILLPEDFHFNPLNK